MNTINPRLIAFAQTVFYTGAAAVIPLLVSALGVDGVLYQILLHILPQWVMNGGITVGLIWVLNYYDNKISAKNGGAMFGAIS